MGPRRQILHIYNTFNWILFNFFILCQQPTRLNVIKNDNESWDYTKPYLVRRGKTHTVYLAFISCQYIILTIESDYDPWTVLGDPSFLKYRGSYQVEGRSSFSLNSM